MRRSCPAVRCSAALVVAFVGLGAATRPAAAQSPADTLPRFGEVVARSDSVGLVQAAYDALEGRAGLEVPMRVIRMRQQGATAEVTMQPVETPGVVWRNYGGTVRILADGRRLIVARG